MVKIELKIVYKNIEDLEAYELNAKIHDQTQVEQIANSIKEFGFVQPAVVDKNNVIVIGHGRIEALKQLGYNEVPCVCVDELTSDQVKALRLADNKTNESDWDDKLLAIDLESISFDMTEFGFDCLGSLLEDEEEKEEKPEVEFTETLDEEHNYIVLYFDNKVDWLQANTLFDIKSVKEYSTRKDGKMPKTAKRGVGRVLNGANALNRVLGGAFSEN